MSASLAPECNKVKERYDSCFLKWYSEKFLRGNAKSDECDPLFTQYRECLGVCSIQEQDKMVAHLLFQKALQSRGIDKMLDDAREDSRETDQEYLKKG
ncbi:hypothetical protein Vi05172_g5800 [Venturia inaequalis]|nr:hypothetical protein Vi05172_g5800 [Venturia inaequalis]